MQARGRGVTRRRSTRGLAPHHTPHGTRVPGFVGAPGTRRSARLVRCAGCGGAVAPVTRD